MRQARRLDLSSIYVAAAGSGALLSMAAPRLAPIVALTLAGIYMLAHWRFGKRLPSTPANLALGLLALIILINPLVSVRRAITLPIAMQMLIGISLLLSLAAWTTTVERLRQSAIWLAAIGALLVIAAPFTVDWITDKYVTLPSIFYSWILPLSRKVIHPNIVAGAVAVLFVTLVTFQRFAWRTLCTLERIVLAVTSFCLAALLIVTQSRGALLGVSLGLVTMALLPPTKKRIGMTFAGCMVLFLVILRATNFDLSILADSSSSIRGASGRLEIWTHAAEIVGDFPLTGIGFGNFSAVADLFYPFLIAGSDITHAHDLFLQIPVDIGWTGLVAWLACLSLVLLSCIQAFRYSYSRNSPIVTGMSAGLLCGQLTMIVHGLTDAPLWATRPAFIVWVLWGIALALPAIRIKKI